MTGASQQKLGWLTGRSVETARVSHSGYLGLWEALGDVCVYPWLGKTGSSCRRGLGQPLPPGSPGESLRPL